MFNNAMGSDPMAFPIFSSLGGIVIPPLLYRQLQSSSNPSSLYLIADIDRITSTVSQWSPVCD